VKFSHEFDKAGKSVDLGGIIGRSSLSQDAFHRMIGIEERRAKRSCKCFLLMLVGLNILALDSRESLVVNRKMLSALSPVTRETDVIGWYEENSVAGFLFTEVATEEVNTVTAAIMNRVSKTLKTHLTPREFADVNLSFHLLPETETRDFSPLPVSSVYPELVAVSSVSGS
jgi:hypothetical protein